ncbi:hypothetical protein [Sphingomonas hankookensis]
MVVIAAFAFGAPAFCASSRTVSPVVLPFAIEEIYGKRPVVAVRLNDHPFKMVIHSNAGFSAQLPHDVARRAAVSIVRHSGDFGIEGPGKVSVLGRDEGVLPRLQVGSRTYSDVAVSVFETPGEQSTGMLGLDWIAARRLVIDYPRHRIVLDSSAKDGIRLRRTLVGQGYRAIPMRRNADGRYTVAVTLEATTRPMTVSTVAGLTIDQTFARAAGVELGVVINDDYGPRGAKVSTYATRRPITLTIGPWRSTPIADAGVLDNAAYMSKPRSPEDGNGGMLGADFLIANRAVVDFGSGVLYLRRPGHSSP